MRARILLLLEVLECKVVRLVPNLIDVCSDKFIGGPVVVNLQLTREVVASLAQACAAGLLTIGSLHGGLAARARHLRLGSGTLVARGPCILHSVGMNGVRQSRSILTLLRQFGARVAALLNWRCLPAAAKNDWRRRFGRTPDRGFDATGTTQQHGEHRKPPGQA